MDAVRSQQIADILKQTKTLTKDLKKPTVIAPRTQRAIDYSQAKLQATTFTAPTWIRTALYVIAGILAIGLIILAIDQWITPIFKRLPIGLIPGTDSTLVFWTNIDTPDKPIDNIPISKTLGDTKIAAATVLEGQAQYAITADIYIVDELPQDISGHPNRYLFAMGPSVANPILTITMPNISNDITVNVYNTDGTIESAQIDNVPIHKSFRVGIIKTPNVLELYLNGKLSKTRQLGSSAPIPSSSTVIFAPNNLLLAETLLSTGIKIMNVRTFGYAPSVKEMSSRMSDFTLYKNII